MRVLQVTTTYLPELKFGGPPQKIHALNCGLKARDHEVGVLTFCSERASGHGTEIIDGIQVEYLPWIGNGMRQIPIDLRALAAAVRRAEVIHCYGLYNLLCPIVALFAVLYRRPYLIEPLGMYIPRTGNVRAKWIYHRLFTGWMMKYAARIIATSEAESNELSPYADKRKIVIRRNGIEPSHFEKLPDGSLFRAKHDIGDQQRLILFLGRISPIKNLEQLISAFKIADLKNARMVLVGPMLEQEYAHRLQAHIAELQLTQQVSLLGPLYEKEKLAAFAAADLFVLPSLNESFGIAVAEAVAAGIPVLLTDTCGTAPLIHGRAGLAVPVGVQDLALGLRVMLDDAEYCREMTRQRADVLKELTWEEPLEKTVTMYAVVTEERDRVGA